MDPEDMMPCGNCPVCDEMVDHSEAGFCKTCGGAFHWSRCGSWGTGPYGDHGHQCSECVVPEDEDD